MRATRRRRQAFAALMAALLLMLSAAVPDAAPILAGEPQSAIRCPRKVGGMRHRPSSVGASETSLQCFYARRRFGDGELRLAVRWRPDTPATRRQCSARDPQPADGGAGGPEDFNRSLAHPDRAAGGTYYVTEGRRITRAQAEKALLDMLQAAAPFGHPCVPDPEPVPADGLACPLVLGGAYVRQDWYGDDAPTVSPIGAPSDQRFDFECRYRAAYTEEGDSASLRVAWYEGAPDAGVGPVYCNPQEKDDGTATTVADGSAPVLGRITSELVAAGGRPVLDRLMQAFAARTSPCPGVSTPSPTALAAPPRLTTIVVTGGPGDPRPSTGDRIALSEDDQYGLVVSGADGSVIREEFIGTEGTIVDIGALVEDADGGWAILITIEVDASSPVATSRPSLLPATTPAGATASTSPASTTPPTIVPPTPVAVPTSPPPPSPAPTGIPAPSPTSRTSLDPVGDAAADRAIAAIGAHIVRLADAAASDGSATVLIPAVDLEALVALAPDVASRVRPASGTIIVATDLGEILVTPDIDPATGLLEFHLSRFAWARTLPVVQQLIGALNGGIAAQGVRLQQVQVSPDGIELRAGRPG